MSRRSTVQSYGAISRLFHWTTAALILANIPLGAIANRLPYDSAQALALKAQVFSIHKTLGVVVFLIALGRIVWTLFETHPAPLHPDRRGELWLAGLVHWMLYVSLVAVPLTGWVHHAAVTGFAPILWPFGQTLPFVPQSEAVATTAGSLHWVFTKLLVGSVLLHVAGALKHHFVDRDATLRRMWRGTSAPDRVVWPRASVLPALAAVALFGLGAAVVALPRGGQTPAATATATQAPIPTAGNWQVTEGTLGFGVQQMGQAVAGQFANWTADIRFDPASGTGAVTVTIDTGSLTLGSVTQQAKSADFFDTAQFPQAIFAAEIAPTDTGYEARGTLTLRGAVQPVTLPFTLDLNGDTARMTGSIRLDRRDFGVGVSYGDESSVGFGVDVIISLTASQSL